MFFVAFLGPIFAIIVFNVVVYIVVVVILIKHTRGTMARKNESLNSKTLIRLMISLAGVMFLFGLSWLFGALTITVTGIRLTFQILFAIFTSLQGFFIFLFFCVMSREARELWKESLSCGRYKSTFLNPNNNIRIASSAGTNRKNGTNFGTAAYKTKSTENSSISTSKPPISLSTEDMINSCDESADERYQEPPAKMNLSMAPRDFASTAGEEGMEAETDIDADNPEAPQERTQDVQVELEAGDFATEVLATYETAAEEVRVTFD